ncbi:MAG: response regulator transcription factor [Anaerolineae bacterium]|nr:response regulator transcription factor [Anaerolineae bacterium]
MGQRILVVDDDRMTAELIRTYLERDRYQVMIADNGRSALEVARSKQPDLIVLDLMLPRVDGLDVCRILRADSDVPIIMLTAKSTESDVLLGLDLGADDYITKPFSPREVVARVRTVLRRLRRDTFETPEELHYGDLVVHFVRHEVQVGGASVQLTRREFDLLETMVKEPGRVFTRAELLERCFGLDSNSTERAIDFHIMNLRRKIEPDAEPPQYIQTVFGVGYKFAG